MLYKWLEFQTCMMLDQRVNDTWAHSLDLKKKFLISSVLGFFFSSVVLQEGRLKIYLLNFSFLNCESPFQFHLTRRVGYGQPQTPVCCVCLQNKLMICSWMLASCWLLCFTFILSLLFRLEQNILHFFLILGELFHRIFTWKPIDSVLYVKKE